MDAYHAELAAKFLEENKEAFIKWLAKNNETKHTDSQLADNTIQDLFFYGA